MIIKKLFKLLIVLITFLNLSMIIWG